MMINYGTFTPFFKNITLINIWFTANTGFLHNSIKARFISKYIKLQWKTLVTTNTGHISEENNKMHIAITDSTGISLDRRWAGILQLQYFLM